MGLNIDIQHQKIEGAMMSMMQELEKLAPHPDRPAYNGPLFVQINSEHKPPAHYEGMLGSVMLESILGTAFAEAVSSNATAAGWTRTFSNMNFADSAEVTSEYIQDRQPRTSFKLGQKSAIAGTFNANGARQEAMNAYLRDLPRRLGLERRLAEYQRRLHAMRKQARLLGLKLAA